MSCGTRAQESRPGDPDGAWLLRSSLWDQSLTKTSTAYCTVACGSATLRQPAPSPVLLLHWLSAPLPNFPVRTSAADAFTGVLLTDFTAARQFVSARSCFLSVLREKLYPCNHRMSTPANIDFAMFGAEVICPESRGRHPPREDPGEDPGEDPALPAWRGVSPRHLLARSPLSNLEETEVLRLDAEQLDELLARATGQSDTLESLRVRIAEQVLASDAGGQGSARREARSPHGFSDYLTRLDDSAGAERAGVSPGHVKGAWSCCRSARRGVALPTYRHNCG
jgi:hypothetical protein